MPKSKYLVFWFLLLPFCSIAQQVKSFAVYKYVKSGGDLTGALWADFAELKKGNKPLLQMPDSSRLRFQMILKSAKCKRLRQQKTGQRLLFAKISDSSGNYSDIVILRGGGIMNLTERKKYWIKSQNDIQWLDNLRNYIESISVK